MPNVSAVIVALVEPHQGAKNLIHRKVWRPRLHYNRVTPKNHTSERRLHTTRAAIVSLRSSVLKLDTVTKQVFHSFVCCAVATIELVNAKSWPYEVYVVPYRENEIRWHHPWGIPVVVGYRSSRYVDPGVLYHGRHNIPHTAARTVRGTCYHKPALPSVNLGALNAGSVCYKFTTVAQWIGNCKLNVAAIVEMVSRQIMDRRNLGRWNLHCRYRDSQNLDDSKLLTTSQIWHW